MAVRPYQARNAARGIATERRAMGELQAAGYTVVRAAGSHGPFDLIAIRADGIKAIQIKSVKRPKRWTRVLAELAAIRRPPNTEVELWVWLYGQGWIEKTPVPYQSPEEDE